MSSETEIDRPIFALGRNGPRLLHLGDAPYAEVHWVDRKETGQYSFVLEPGVPRRLDRYVTRLIAPNAGAMTGPGTNTYLVGENDLVVIDPGPADAAHLDAILAAGDGRIRLILLTHTHADHASAVAMLQDATGAAVAGRRADFPGREDRPVILDRIVGGGESIEWQGLVLKAIHTPGHASNHVCYLLDRTRMLFTGDHIMQGSTVVIAPPDGNLRAYLRSLEQLLAVEISILAPGHGYLIGDPASEVRRLIRHRLAREAKVRCAVSAAQGKVAVETLVQTVYADVPSALHAVAAHSLRAHLEKLVEDGELVCHDGLYSVS